MRRIRDEEHRIQDQGRDFYSSGELNLSSGNFFLDSAFCAQLHCCCSRLSHKMALWDHLNLHEFHFTTTTPLSERKLTYRREWLGVNDTGNRGAVCPLGV
ncbi:hypothetical protein KOW79_015147 [Hemibagrus wyckioides]|uniref:Uncharacterized protein n=1 Tax=Hemibagrus wyckioides TaxID=337641 RepID=A0A9D3NH54_9TELE|nr:hypothetical protein KOW79_015147 [Hemibagrus wyckioides]